MKYLTLLLAILHLTSQLPSAASVDVQCNVVCNCTVTPEKDHANITCPQDSDITLEHRFQGTYKNGHVNVIVRCQQPHADLSSIFTDINIFANRHSTTVKIRGCTLPNTSLSDFLASIGVRDFEELFITSYSGSLQRKYFESLDTVRQLNIAQSDLGDFPVDIFAGLKSMTELKIEFSSFKLTEGMFRFTPKLESLHFDRHFISEVSFDVFNNLTRLEALIIEGANNTFITFDETRRYIAPSLSYLNLESIGIKTLSHVLERTLNKNELSSVEYIGVDLSKQIRYLLQSTKIAGLKLTNITASRVLLQHWCFADLFNLNEIFLPANNLKFVPEDAFSNSEKIGVLDLSDNLINTFEENLFSNLGRLRYLNARNNKIFHLPEGLFFGTKSLTSLDLSHNLLEHIEP